MNEIVGGVNESKVRHGDLILQGVCSHCAHCGMALTDSVSIERGLGPTCSKKGYSEDPSFNEGQDPMDAMIYVAAWSDLMKFLTERASSGDPRRGLMNGLVRVCSLNRQNKVLFKSCCEAIEALGWKRLAYTLRESLTIIRMKVAPNPDFWEVRVLHARRKWEWVQDIREIPGCEYRRSPTAHNLVPKSQKAALWKLFVKHYPGEFGKGQEGAFKIPTSLEDQEVDTSK